MNPKKAELAHSHSRKTENELRRLSIEGPPSRLETAQKVASVAMLLVSGMIIARGLPAIYENISTIIERDQQQVSYAQQISELYDDADIAVIPFEMDMQPAEQIGANIESTFNDLNDGIISIDVDIIEPSAAARQAYESINGDNCVDKDDVNNYGSFIAESAMPELKDYDKILAINTDASCQEGIAGVALSYAHEGRYAEVFGGAGDWKRIQDNAGSQELMTLDAEGNTLIERLNSPADTGVHELYHLFGLGHAGLLYTPAEHRGGPLQFKVGADYPKHIDFDVHDAVKQLSYVEYAEVGVMGRSYLEFSDSLSTVEKYALEWPERRLGDDTQVSVYDLNNDKVEFTPETIGDALAVYRFTNPIAVKGLEHEYSLNRIVFVPSMQPNDRNPGVIDSVDVYLMDENNNTARFNGPMFNIFQQKTSFTLDLDGEKLTVTLDYDDNKVTIAKGEAQQ